MSSSDKPHPAGNFVRNAIWAGMLSSALFVVVFIFEDIFQPGYDWLSRAVSEHSIGPLGWTQISNFIVSGALLLVFSHGIASIFREGPMSKVGPLFLLILSLSIMGSGPFVTDPAPVVMFSSSSTWNGNVHGILGAIAFTLMSLTCLVFYLRFRKEPKWVSFGKWSLAAFFIILLSIALLKNAQLGVMGAYLGLFQRISLVTFFSWVFTLTMRLRKQQ